MSPQPAAPLSPATPPVRIGVGIDTSRCDGGTESGGQPAGRGERNNQAAGNKPVSKQAEEVVTAACASTVVPAGSVGERTWIGFAHLKS
jgi:hypothetical protein